MPHIQFSRSVNGTWKWRIDWKDGTQEITNISDSYDTFEQAYCAFQHFCEAEHIVL